MHKRHTNHEVYLWLCRVLDFPVELPDGPYRKRPVYRNSWRLEPAVRDDQVDPELQLAVFINGMAPYEALHDRWPRCEDLVRGAGTTRSSVLDDRPFVVGDVGSGELKRLLRRLRVDGL